MAYHKHGESHVNVKPGARKVKANVTLNEEACACHLGVATFLHNDNKNTL